jgi:hypothetical protein
MHAMALANLVSTIPGVIIGALVASSAATVVGLVLLGTLTAVVGRLFCRDLVGTRWHNMGMGWFALFTCVLALGSFAGGQALMGPPDPLVAPVTYWSIKLFAVTTGFVASLVFTVLWEGVVVVRFAEPAERPRVLKATLDANVWTFLVIFLVGALVALPVRMRNPDGMYPGPG